jgi:hypothetical protein
MHKEELLDICSILLDKITVIKGYVQLKLESKNIDYLLLIQEIDEIEIMVKRIVDTIKSN